MMRCLFRVKENVQMLVSCLAVVLLVLMQVSSAESAVPLVDPPKNILLLYSSAPNPWTTEVFQGVRQELSDDRCNFFEEFMDAHWNSSPAYLHALKAVYAEKYLHTHFDAIIATENEALEFLLVNRDTLFPGVPVLFCGVEGYSPDMLGGRINFSGVTWDNEYERALQVARKLQPGARRVIVVADRSLSGRHALASFMTVAGRKHSDLQIELLQDVTAEQLALRLREAPPDSFVFLLSFWRDVSGRPVTLDMLSSFLQYSAVPVFDRMEWLVGRGAIGGLCVSGREQGKAVAALVHNVFEGAPVSAQSVAHHPAASYVFDLAGLEAFDISKDLLPKGSELLAPPEPVFELRHSLAVALGGGLSLAVFLTFWFAAANFRRAAVQRKLGKKQERFQQIIDETPAIICGVSPEGVTEFINPYGLKAIEYSKSEILGKDWWHTLYVGEKYTQVEKLFQDMGPEGVRGYEMALHTRSGAEKIISWTSMNILDSAGKIKEVIGYGDDVTARRQAEIALRQSEKRYHMLFDAAYDTLLVLHDGQIIECNQRAEEMFAAPREEILGRSPVDFSPRNQKEGASQREAERLIQEAVEGTSRVFYWRHMRANGEGFDAEVSLSSYELDDRQYVLAIVRDVTEARRLLEHGAQTEKMRSLTGLAAGMAHEINNPLGVIIQSVQNIERRLSPNLPANTRVASQIGMKLPVLQGYLDERGVLRMLEAIRQAGGRAASIVRGLLDFGKWESDNSVSCDVPLAVRNVVELIREDVELDELYGGKNVRFETDIDESQHCVPVSQSGFEQALQHLCRNAVQAMGELGKKQKIQPVLSLRSYVQDEVLVFEVEDSGPGVPEEDRKQIFEPFYTTAGSAGAERRTGLGLAVCYFILVQSFGGRLFVEDSTRGGAKFVIHLPLREGTVCPLNLAEESDA